MKKLFLILLSIAITLNTFAQREQSDCQKMREKRHQFAEQATAYNASYKNGSQQTALYTDSLSRWFRDLDDYYVYMSKQTGDEAAIARVYRYMTLSSYLSYLAYTRQYEKLLDAAKTNAYTISQSLWPREVICKSVAAYKMVYTYKEDEYGNIMATGKKVPDINSVITIPQADIENTIGNLNFTLMVAASATGNIPLRDSVFLDAYQKNVFASPGPFNYASGRLMIADYNSARPITDTEIKGAIVAIGGYPSRLNSDKPDTAFRQKAITMIQNRWLAGLDADKDDIVTNTEALRLVAYTRELKAEKLYQMLKGNFAYLKAVSQFYQKNGLSPARAYNTIGKQLAEALFQIDDKIFLSELIGQLNLYKESLEINNVALLYTAYTYCRDHGDKVMAKELYKAIANSKTKYPQYPK